MIFQTKGRSGEWFTHQAFDIEPDILCIGKGFGGGLVPIAAMVTKTNTTQQRKSHLVITPMRRALLVARQYWPPWK